MIVVDVGAVFSGMPYNPSTDPVWVAFMPGAAQPGSADWHTASWDVTQTGGHIAQILVGPDPGGVPLTVGTWTIWVRVDDNPEKVKRDVGLLAIY